MASTRTKPPIIETETEEKPQSQRRQLQPAGPRELQLSEQGVRRSLTSQITTALLQPANFFRTLPATQYTRQWVWVGLLILALVGFSAVRYDALQNQAGDATDTGTPTDGGFPPVDEGGGGGGIDFGGVPPGAGGDATGETETEATPEEVTARWSIALEAAGEIVLQWLVIAILLSEVSLLRGKKPRLGHNWQIAIYSSLPFGLMAALQLAYYYAGGKIGEEGLSGFIEQWKGYADLSEFQKDIAYSLSTRLTLFWLWSLGLLYLGARYGLKGRTWTAGLMVVAWVVVLVIGPVVAGWVEAPKTEADAEIAPMDIPMDMPSMEEGPFEEPSIEEGGGRGPVKGESPAIEVAPANGQKG